MADLRETLAAAIDAAPVVDAPPVVGAPAPAPAPAALPANESALTASEARARDEAGRFSKTTQAAAPALKAAPQAPGSATTGAVTPPPAAEPPVAAAPAPEIKAPSTWKPEYQEAYKKLAVDNPALAKYMVQREQEFARGVSTYRQEAEQSRELQNAIAPFMAELQQHNIAPSQWISSLGGAHRTLAMGGPAEKIQMFGKLAQDYGVSVPHLVAYLSGNPQALQGLPAPQQQQPVVAQPQDMREQYRQFAQEDRLQAEVKAMAENSAEYPHFEAVRETMKGLLLSGLAPDYKSAYDKAIRHDDEFWQAEQLRRAEDAEKQRLAAEAARVKTARANVTSTRSVTPAGTMVLNGKKGLRDTIADNVEAAVGGRV